MPKRIPSLNPRKAYKIPMATDLGSPERKAFYDSARWRRLRAAFIKANPICAECERQRLATIATTVHHKVERLAHPELALDRGNLEALCSSCHTRLHKSSKGVEGKG